MDKREIEAHLIAGHMGSGGSTGYRAGARRGRRIVPVPPVTRERRKLDDVFTRRGRGRKANHRKAGETFDTTEESLVVVSY